jgi:chemotaxis protein MotA
LESDDVSEFDRVVRGTGTKAAGLAAGPSATCRHVSLTFLIQAMAEADDRMPSVFESAGGFSPTIGILGAVLGLIQVMQHLDNIQEVGRGIAVAFVATISGVGAANLFFLPFAGKMRIQLREEHLKREMMLEGVISILEGMNPRMLELKLGGFLHDSSRPKRERAHESAS